MKSTYITGNKASHRAMTANEVRDFEIKIIDERKRLGVPSDQLLRGLSVENSVEVQSCPVCMIFYEADVVQCPGCSSS